MALQAFIDDSMASGQVLVMAGYISTVERWSSFSDEWQQRLDMKPRMTRFKMSEVDLNSELQMERVRHFYRVIEEHVIAQVAVAVNISQLKQMVPQLYVNSYLENPYFLAHKAIVNVTAQLQREAGIVDPIDFIFDERSEEPALHRAFQEYMAHLPPEFAEVTGAKPIFRNDERFLPLQAADLYAWWMRRQWLADGAIDKRYVQYPWTTKYAIPAIVLELSGDELTGELITIHNRRGGVPLALMTVTVNFRGLSEAGHQSGDE